MTDTFKETHGERTFWYTWSANKVWVIVDSSPLNLDSDTGFVNHDDSFAICLNDRVTTERNIKKNTGISRRFNRPMVYEQKFVDSGKKRPVRRFDFRTKKWITTYEPILVERVVRKNPRPEVCGPKLLVNDLVRRVRTISRPSEVNSFIYPEECWDDVNLRWIAGTHVYNPQGDITKHYPRADVTGYASYEDLVPIDDITVRYAMHINLLKDKALRKLYASIKNQPADLGTDIADGRQTIRMFVDMVDRLAAFLLSIRKKDFRKSFRDLFPVNSKELANDFLAYRYGLAPLIQDLSGMYAEYKKHMTESFDLDATGRATQVFSFDDSGDPEPFQPSITRTVTITVKYKVFFSVPDYIRALIDRLGFTNPLNVGWELIPFSFVVDWFIPIGPFLNAIGTLDHLTVNSIHRTIVIREDCYYSNGLLAKETSFSRRYGPQSAGYFEWHVSNFYLERKVLPPFLEGMPVPTFKNPVSMGHFANFTALVTQFFNRSKL